MGKEGFGIFPYHDLQGRLSAEDQNKKGERINGNPGPQASSRHPPVNYPREGHKGARVGEVGVPVRIRLHRSHVDKADDRDKRPKEPGPADEQVGGLVCQSEGEHRDTD